MPHRFAEPLFQHLRRAFPPERAYTRVDFERAPMPSMVAHFLTQTLRRRFDLEMEQLRAVRSPWFDYDHPEVQEAYGMLAETLLRRARIPREEWERTLREAVHRVTAYLVRPTHTLVAFVFNEEEGALPAHVVYRRAAYFDAYPYLRAAIEAYFERKGTVEISRARFAELLARVDWQMTADYDADQWLGLLEPLLRLPGPWALEEPGVPVAVLLRFFEDKGASSIVARLEAAARAGVTRLEEEPLHRLIAEALGAARPAASRPTASAASAPPSPPAAAPPPAAPPAAAPQPATPPASAAAAPPEPPAELPAGDETVPLWKRFMRAPAEATPGAPTPAAPAPPSPDAVPLWMRFRSSADAGDADLPTLEKAILGEQAPLNRDRFIKHLFSGSAEAYEQVLRRLYAAPTWTQASQIIAQDVFKAHQVNIYSPPAIAFTNAVEARYREEPPA